MNKVNVFCINIRKRGRQPLTGLIRPDESVFARCSFCGNKKAAALATAFL